MPKLDIASIRIETGTGYPEPFRKQVEGRSRQRLGNAAGLTQFGVNLTRLKPGAWSAQRRWHEIQDEFVYVLEGELTLVENEGEMILRPGDAAGFKAGVPNGHCLQNRKDRDAVYLEFGTRSKTERAHCPDVDLAAVDDGEGLRFTHKSGEPY